jgi:hypothetical protein
MHALGRSKNLSSVTWHDLVALRGSAGSADCSHIDPL